MHCLPSPARCPTSGRYEVVILGSPVWGSRAPRIMSTFLDGVDLGGKTVLPLVTYAVSGMSGIDDCLPQRADHRDG